MVDQTTATQAEVDQAEEKLRSAVKQLVKVPTKEVDKTNLLKIIKENEKHQEKDYTASSWKVYSEALKQAQTVVDQATATQAEVDQAEAELGSAVKQLVKVPTIDKTNLLKIIKENEKNQEKDYTASSWKVYSEALQQAQTVADQTTATQAEVDQAEEKLRSAVKQLVKVPTKEVDKTNLFQCFAVDFPAACGVVFFLVFLIFFDDFQQVGFIYFFSWHFYQLLHCRT